ncbi:hypothetical protein [Solicola sp. PLA-1-18]|uniref:hypothetical protein n=1 Tax=Solicola sp. PLA-1-18 TaxID=3380532 RepID=UPI003B7A813A
MAHSILSVRRAVPAAVAALLALAVAPTAFADSAPTNPSDPRTPTTITADALPTVQINGVAWTQVVVGNTVYAGGNFTSARPAGSPAGTNETPRSYLLAYDITTGVLKTGFAPVLNGQVLSLAASPDGTKIYAGGQFDRANGAIRSRIAAFDATTGALDPTFKPLAQTTVRSVAVTADTVYFGGDFAKVNSIARGYVAAASRTTGALLPFNPGANAPVTAMTLTPDRSTLVLGGRFTTVGGAAGYGMAAVDPATGARRTWLANQVVRNAGSAASITSLTADGDSVYGTGYVFGSGGNFEGTFRARPSDGAITWLEDCHGDSYSSYSLDQAVYVVGHPHHCENIGGFPEVTPRVAHRGVAFSKAVTGLVRPNNQGGYANFAGQPAPTQLNWFPTLNVGSFTGQSQAAWSVAGNGTYVTFAGEFPAVNNRAQQGLVRMSTSTRAPNKVGPALTSDLTPTVTSTVRGVVTASWTSASDLDNTTLTYRLIRNGAVVRTLTGDSVFYSRPRLSATDTGLTPGATYRYRVSATDPFGNVVTSPEATVVARS